MKRLLWIIAFLLVVLCARQAMADDIKVQPGFCFDWWKSNVNTRGSQFSVPLRIEGRYKDFSYGILTGYAYTHYDPNGAESRSMRESLDTKVNISYEIAAAFPVDIILGLDLNLPTGKRGGDHEIFRDSDLFPIKGPGEGFNVNPTLNVAKEWGRWVGGAGFGFVWRGEYNYSQDLPDYDPGDIFNAAAEIRYDFSPDWQGRLFNNYAHYSKDQVQGQDFYQEGDSFLLGLGVHFFQTAWDMEGVLQSVLRGKSKIPAGPWIPIESRINHGDEWLLHISHRYFLDERTSMRSFVELLRIDENDYPLESVFFISGREKYSLGTGVRRILRSNLEAEFDIRAFLLEDEPDFFRPFTERYRGISTGVRLTARF